MEASSPVRNDPSYLILQLFGLRTLPTRLPNCSPRGRRHVRRP